MRTALAMTAALLVWCAPAGAVPARQCPAVTVHGTAYVVTAHGVTCGFARKWVRRYLKSKAHPKHWSCSPPSGTTNVRVNCHGATKPKNDTAFRYYYGIKT
jgi:hypothetical protein